MRYVKTFEKFDKINEIVYLGKTVFASYSFAANRMDNYGSMNISLDNGDDINFNIETYGKPGESDAKSKQFIFQVDHMSYREDLVDIINTTIYILNKNKLDYKFSADANKPYRYSMQTYYMLNVDTHINITELEQVINTTKIVNAKIKDIGDLDKLIYLTK